MKTVGARAWRFGRFSASGFMPCNTAPDRDKIVNWPRSVTPTPAPVVPSCVRVAEDRDPEAARITMERLYARDSSRNLSPKSCRTQ